jgi:heptosyltransferase II
LHKTSVLYRVKILIIQTAFIGDVVLATPLISKLARFYPEATIDCLVRKGNESLLQRPDLRQVLVWDKKQGKYRDLWRIFKQIRQERYDLVINCQRFAASGLLTAFSGATTTIGFAKNPLSWLFSRRIAHHFGPGNSRFGLPYWHEIDRNLSLIDALTDTSAERPSLVLDEHDRTRAQSVAMQRQYVCMAPTSVWFTKQWPAEQWANLINTIPAHIAVFLLGGLDDKAACDHIIQLAQRQQVENWAGQLNFRASAALMAGAVMNYVNDSAPLHFASAVNAPVTAIFCSTLPEFGFTPLSDNSRVVETALPLPCRPCGLHGKSACPQGHYNCAKIDLKFVEA